jgi:hypothetical protein
MVDRLLEGTDFQQFNYYPMINEFGLKQENPHVDEYTGPAEGAHYLGWGATISTLLTAAYLM